MTRAEALELHPHSRGSYIGGLLISLLMAGLYFAVPPRRPPVDHCAGLLMIILLTLMAAQCASRLLLPITSAKLTFWITRHDISKAILLTVSLLTLAFYIIGFARGLHSEVRMLANTCLLLPLAVADLLGKSSPYSPKYTDPPYPDSPWHGSLKPIQSEHWGDRTP